MDGTLANTDKDQQTQMDIASNDDNQIDDNPIETSNENLEMTNEETHPDTDLNSTSKKTKKKSKLVQEQSFYQSNLLYYFAFQYFSSMYH